VSDDDRALMERLAALEAEVKADHTVKERAQAAAAAKMEELKREREAEAAALAAKEARAKPTAIARRPVIDDAADDDDSSLGSALALAKKAHGVKQEIARQPKAGEKSLVKAGLASLLLGPLGWLYAGSWREAIPASAIWLLIGAAASKIIPMFLLMPVMMVVLPASAIAGMMYASRYNKHGKRQRLFAKKPEEQKQLAAPPRQPKKR